MSLLFLELLEELVLLLVDLRQELLALPFEISQRRVVAGDEPRRLRVLVVESAARGLLLVKPQIRVFQMQLVLHAWRRHAVVLSPASAASRLECVVHDLVFDFVHLFDGSAIIHVVQVQFLDLLPRRHVPQEVLHVDQRLAIQQVLVSWLLLLLLAIRTDRCLFLSLHG